jgi:hypothetical protein
VGGATAISGIAHLLSRQPSRKWPEESNEDPRAMTEMAFDDSAYGACCYRFVDSRPSPRLLGLY